MQGSIGKSNRVIGSLNNGFSRVEYAGKESNTAVVSIDNKKRTIEVNVSKLPHDFIIEDHTGAEASTINFNGSEEKRVVLKDWTLKKVDPELDTTLAEYSLLKDGEEIGDRILIQKDQALTKAALISVNSDNLAEIQEQCQDAKEGDSCLDLVVANQIDGNKDKHYYILLAIFNDGLDAVNSKLQNEISRATEEEAKLNTTINNESARAQQKENALESSLTEAKESLQASINSVNDDLQEKINATNTSLSNEKDRATKAEQQLTEKITAEASTREQALEDMTSYLNTEKTIREAADSELKSDLNKEITDRQTADSDLTNNELRFTKEAGTTIALGGIAKGTTFKNKKLMDIINEMLYPYVPFSITGFSLSPNNGGTFENGSSVTLTGSTTNINAGSEDIKRITIYDGSTKLGEKKDNISGTAFSIPVELTITANKTLKTEVEDAKGTILSRNSSSFNFIYPFYYGSLESGILDADNIKKLTKLIQTKGNKKLSFTHSDKCCAIAYPAAYGDLKSAIDQNNFDVTASFIKHEVKIIGLDKKEVNYFVYVNSPSTLDKFSITFNF